MSCTESESDDSQEFASIPTSPHLESEAHYYSDLGHEDESTDDELDSEQPAKPDVFRVLVTGFGVSSAHNISRVVLTTAAIRPMGS